MMASSSKKSQASPLTGLGPLHALAQLIPGMPSDTGGRTRDIDFVLVTNLKLDAWFVHVGHPDGRWWNGAWHAADVESLSVRPPSRLSRARSLTYYLLFRRAI